MNGTPPFQVGNPVTVDKFLGRRRELRRTASRLRQGESTALVGEPRTGKTSLLFYLSAPEIQTELYGEAAEGFIFSYLDSQSLGGQFTPAQFWEQALLPVKERLCVPHPETPVAQQFAICEENGYGTYTLEVLFRRLHEAGRRLVLLLDEFNLILHHAVLNNAEFYGGLRSLTSRCESLSLVIASRLSLTRLNSETLVFNPTGSPYFNTFTELTLGDFPDTDVETLLRRGEDFTPADRGAIRRLTGRHPFLLQAAAEAMVDARAEGLDSEQRRAFVGDRIYREQRQHFADTWRNWSPESRQLFTVVGLANMHNQLPDRRFRLDNLLADIAGWGPELGEMKHSGLLEPSETIPGGWKVTRQIMLWWLADELVQAMRSESDFSQWLSSEELEGRWTRNQREQMIDAAKNSVQVVYQLMDAFTKGKGFLDTMMG